VFRMIEDLDLFATDMEAETFLIRACKELFLGDPDQTAVAKSTPTLPFPQFNFLGALEEATDRPLRTERDWLSAIDSITIFNLSLEFGSSGAPGRFKQYALAAELATNHQGCVDPRVNGSEGFGTKTFVDDAANVEPDLGRRCYIADRSYEKNARAILGATAIEEEKKKQ